MTNYFRRNLQAALLLAVLTFAIGFPMVASFTGCTTTAQRQAVNTIGSVETTATAAVDGYFSAVIQGNASTNGVPTVTKAYNSLQQAIKLALVEVQNNTNALAPQSLQDSLTQLQNLITQAKGN